jgi:hypothetical protein
MLALQRSKIPTRTIGLLHSAKFERGRVAQCHDGA